MQLANTLAFARHERTPFDGCPLCGGKTITEEHRADSSVHALWRPVFDKWITWLKCSDCSHSFTSGYYAGEAMAELLDKIQQSQAPGANFEKLRLICAPIVERCVGVLGGSGGSWLDVGPGSGALVATAAEYGFDAVGVEIRPYVADALNSLGIKTICGEIESVGGSFDVVSMADVLEHVPYPASLLNAARQRLTQGGLLFVSCPAYDSPAWRMLGDNNPYWWEIEHFHNFSRDRLYRLLDEHGFEPVNYSVSQRYRVGMEVIARKAM